MQTGYYQATIAAVASLLLLGTAGATENEPMVIVVTPTGIEQPRDSVNTSITVIDQQTIKTSNASSVAELLRGQAGLHVSDFFGDGSQSTIDMRGFGPTASSNTLVLLDGRRLNNSSDTATPDLSLIDTNDIERIEILQGSGGVIYGNQAVGGVINIIRKKSLVDQASISTRIGSFDSSQISASGTKVFGRNRLSASVSKRQSDNYRDTNDTDNQRLSVRAERIHNGHTSYVELESIKDDIQTPGALLESEMDDDRTQSLSFYEDDFFETDTKMLRLGMDKKIDETRMLKLDFSARDTEREFIQTFRPFPGNLTTQERDNKFFSASYSVIPADSRVLKSYLVGIDYEDTDYELVSVFGPQVIDQSIQGIFLSSQWAPADSTQFDAGIRYSDQKAEIADDDFDDSVTVINLGISQQLDSIRLFARADQNFRYATVEEHTNVPFGDEPGLKTQEGLSIELGAEITNAGSRYRATIYQIELENEIAFDSSGFSNLNLDETERTGLIIEASNRWSDSISTRLSITSLDAEVTEGSFKGNDIPLVPEQTIRLDASYQYDEATRLAIEILSVDDQVFGGDFANNLDDLPGYEVVNAHINYEQNSWSLGFRINNLLDEEYSETGSQFTDFPPPSFAAVNYESFFPSPERNYWLNFKYRFY